MKTLILKVTNAIALTLVVGWAAVLIGCSGSQATLKPTATSSASSAEAEARAKAKAEAAEAAKAEAEAKKAEAEAKAKAAEAARAAAAAKAQAAAEQAAKDRAFDGSVYFEYNSAVIRNDQKPVLTQLVEKLRANPGYRIKVGGYCDERGTPEYNLALGQKRADVVKKILVRKGKIAPERITTISYGKTRSADPDHDEKSWSKNRRAGFDVTESSDKVETSQR